MQARCRCECGCKELASQGKVRPEESDSAQHGMVPMGVFRVGQGGCWVARIAEPNQTRSDKIITDQAKVKVKERREGGKVTKGPRRHGQVTAQLDAALALCCSHCLCLAASLALLACCWAVWAASAPWLLIGKGQGARGLGEIRIRNGIGIGS